MDDLDRKMRSIKRSLLEHISMFAYKNGHDPAVIFAENEAFDVLVNDIGLCRYPDHDYTWRGIPLRRVAQGGVGIYLSDGPIAIREYPEARGIFGTHFQNGDCT